MAVDQLERDTRNWAMWLHLSQFGAFIIPIVGIIAPIVIWQTKKDELPGVDVHGKNAVNWIISWCIFLAISGILCFIAIGFILLSILMICGIAFPVIAGIKASNGEVWEYPMAIKFCK